MFEPKSYHLPFTPEHLAIQGQEGSFSYWTCSNIFNDCAILYFDTFEEPFEAVANGDADYAIIPIQNTIAGRVPYVHNLINDKKLHIVGEYFLPIEMCVLTLNDPGTADIAPSAIGQRRELRLEQFNLSGITTIHSHKHALAQCDQYLSRHRNQVTPAVHADTAGAAKMIKEMGDPTQASISPAIAAEIYGLHIAQRGVQDRKNNITRFLVISKDPVEYPKADKDQVFMTPVILKPKRNYDWALADILAAFKEAGVRHTAPLEYEGANLRNEGYYMEIMGHRDDPRVRGLLKTIHMTKKGGGITSEQRVLGCFPAHHTNRFGRNPIMS